MEAMNHEVFNLDVADSLAIKEMKNELFNIVVGNDIVIGRNRTLLETFSCCFCKNEANVVVLQI